MKLNYDINEDLLLMIPEEDRDELDIFSEYENADALLEHIINDTLKVTLNKETNIDMTDNNTRISLDTRVLLYMTLYDEVFNNLYSEYTELLNIDIIK